MFQFFINGFYAGIQLATIDKSNMDGHNGQLEILGCYVTKGIQKSTCKS